MKTCPYCAEKIGDAAKFCRYCGRDLSAKSKIVTPVQINKDFEEKLSKGIKEAKKLAMADAERAVIEHRARYDSQPVWLKFMRYFYGYNTGYGRLIITVLTILFVLLKLTSIITWSWWWVLSPLWLPVLLSLLFYFFGFFAFLILEVFKRK